jgi:hypothetical protein
MLVKIDTTSTAEFVRLDNLRSLRTEMAKRIAVLKTLTPEDQRWAVENDDLLREWLEVTR